MNNIISKYLFLIFNLTLGFSLIIYTIYIRVFIIRLPKGLYIITNNQINIGLLLLIIISFFITLFIIYANFIILSNKITKESYFSEYILKITEIIENALYECYIFIGSRFNDPYNKISYLVQKFYKYFQNTSETFFLFLLYIIRIIILISFLIDVFLYFRLDLMYKSLYLLCISLLIKILFFMLKDFSGNLEEAQSYLIIEEQSINPDNNLPLTSYSLKKEFKDLDLAYHVGQFILCSKITGYLKIYDRYAKFFTPYFNIIIYSFYLLGWLYIIIVNCFISL